MSNGGWNIGDLDAEQVKETLSPVLKVGQIIRSKKWLPLAFVGAIAFVLLVSESFFQLEPEEEAIVLRLGKPRPDTYGPGLHSKLPFVDQVHAVPVNRQHRLEFGFRSEPDVVTKVVDTGYDKESLMLTADLMLVHVRWSVVYKIEDIHAWLFKIKDREQTIRDISMAVMRQVVGDYSLEEVLTTKQLEITAMVTEATQAALREKVPTGVVITEIAIRSADVPKAARQAFDDLTRTLARLQGELAEAKAEQDNVIGVARRQKNEAVGQSEKELAQVVENAHGEASAFLAKADEYKRAPEITRQWMYLRTMKQVLEDMEEKIVVDDQGGGVTKHLPLKDFFPAPQKQGGTKE